MLKPHDSAQFTSFPDPASGALSQETESTKKPLHGLLDGTGPSMFDENNTIDANDPQTLSAASTDVLRSIIDHHGAVELVKRLSSLLAERDVHITALTRLAEEYKIPKQRIVDAASRVKQAEHRRLSLATASEDVAPSSGIGSDISVRIPKHIISVDTTDSTLALKDFLMPEGMPQGQFAVNGITKLFAGGKRKESLKPYVFTTKIQVNAAMC